MPDDLLDTAVQRIVVRSGMSMDLAADLLLDIQETVTSLNRLTELLPDVNRSVFHP